MKTKSHLYSRALSALATSILLTSCNNPERDFKKAEQANTEGAFNEFIKRHADSPLVFQASNHIQELAFAKGKAAASVPEYRSYLTRYPAGRFVAQAQANLENIEFAQALESPAIPTLEALLKRYPASTNGPKAKTKLAELLLPGIIGSNSVVYYDAFRKRFAGTDSANTASLKSAKLEYDLAVSASDIASHETFLSKYPDSQFVADIKSRIEPQLEERDWNQALLNNSARAFLDYHKKHERLSRVSVLTGKLRATPAMVMTFNPFGGGGGSSKTKVSLEMTGQRGLPEELSVEEASRFGLINADLVAPGVARVDMQANSYPNASIIILKKTGAILAIDKGMP